MPAGRPASLSNRPIPDDPAEAKIMVQEIQLEKAKLDLLIRRIQDHVKDRQRIGHNT